MLKLFFLAVPATGILMALVGWLPVPKEVRGIAQLGSGLLLIALLILGDSKGEGIAQAMLGGGWIRYIMFIGLLSGGAGLSIRGHHGEEANQTAKIMTIWGRRQSWPPT